MQRFRWLLPALGLLATSPATFGQTYPNLQDMERRMMDLQRRLLQDLQQSPLDGWMTDTTYTFRFDTTFDNGSTHFFRFGTPPDADGFFQEFDRMFNEFFGMPAPTSPPADDGGLRRSEDDLLPEEHLRQQENKAPAPTKAPKPAKRESIRI